MGFSGPVSCFGGLSGYVFSSSGAAPWVAIPVSLDLLVTPLLPSPFESYFFNASSLVGQSGSFGGAHSIVSPWP